MRKAIAVLGLCLALMTSLYASNPATLNENERGELLLQIQELKAAGKFDAELWSRYLAMAVPEGTRGPGRSLDQGGDDCTTPTVIAALPYTDSGTTVGYTDDYNDAFFNFGPDVVYSYTPVVDQIANVDMCGSTFDTVLLIYAGSCVLADLVGVNDDYCGLSSGLEEVPLSAGVTYYFVMDGLGTSAGDYALNITAVTSGRCCYTSNLLCATTTAEVCAALGGDWIEGETCATPCPPPPPPCECGPMDLVFVVDVTGSMGAAIANVVDELPAIMATAEYFSCDVQFGLVQFRDEVTVLHQLTTDAAAVQASIAGLTASGGDGTPEASDEALLEVINGTSSCATNDWTSAFRPTATKVVVLITDALPGGCDDAYTPGVDDVQAHNVALAAQAADILIAAVYVPTGGPDATEQLIMQDYATTTGGSYRQTAENGSGTGAAIASLVADCGSGECVPDCELVTDPCDIPVGCYRTQTQGGWGQDRCRGNNIGCLRDEWFAMAFPGGLVVGGDYTLTLTTSAAVAALLPTGGTPGSLDMNYVNPTSTSAGVFAGQVVSLAISVGFGDAGVPGFGDLGSLVVAAGPFAGWTVDDLLALANEVLGGDLSGLPAGTTIAHLNNAVTAINENFAGGDVANGYLVDPCCDESGLSGFASGEIRRDGGDGTAGAEQPEKVIALENHPNPFNPTTNISFELSEAAFATLKVYNVMGQEVATLLNGPQGAGRHSVTFDAANLPSGLYMYRLETSGKVLQGKMLLLK